jgi:hypothetical protein
MNLRVVVSERDPVMRRYGNQLAFVGERGARVAQSRALNHEGRKGFTQVKRVLVAQTGIRYGDVNKAVREIPSTPVTLTYTLEGRGSETNIAWFHGTQRKKGVSAAPWNKRRIFPHTFLIGAYGGKAFKRLTRQRFPIKPVFGPNLARELVKDRSKAAFMSMTVKVAARVGHELHAMLMGYAPGAR